jgi:hypothetical protein
VLPVILLTPLMLTAEPVNVDTLEQTYDHSTQTSTFKHQVDHRLAQRMKSTVANLCTYSNNDRCGDRSTSADASTDN